MKNIIIVGTGAVAAELTSYIEDNNADLPDDLKTNILGYLEYEQNIENYWKKYQLKYPVICDVDQYIPSENEEVLVGMASINYRNKMIAILESKNANIATFVHKSVIIPPTATLGKGNIIYPFCIIGPMTNIGNYNIITSYSFISHDCIVGDRNFFATAGVAGLVTIGNDNFVGIRATILPNVSIGNNNTIQAGMIVDKSIKDETTVFYRFKEQVLAIPK